MELLEENHEESIRYWIKSQENIIELLKADIENNEKMIKVHGDSLKIHKEQLAHEVKYLQDYKNSLNK